MVSDVSVTVLETVCCAQSLPAFVMIAPRTDPSPVLAKLIVCVDVPMFMRMSDAFAEPSSVVAAEAALNAKP